MFSDTCRGAQVGRRPVGVRSWESRAFRLYSCWFDVGAGRKSLSVMPSCAFRCLEEAVRFAENMPHRRNGGCNVKFVSSLSVLPFGPVKNPPKLLLQDMTVSCESLFLEQRLRPGAVCAAFLVRGRKSAGTCAGTVPRSSWRECVRHRVNWGIWIIWLKWRCGAWLAGEA